MGSENGRERHFIRIGDLARRAGTTMRTVRYYEQRGLIEPAGRTKGGFRLYEDEDVRKLCLIRSLQLLDIPLSQVKAFFDARPNGRPAAEIAPGLQRILREHLDEMERRIAQYRAMQESVLATIDILDACGRCPYEPSPAVCLQCPALAGRATIPPHMQAVIACAERGQKNEGSKTASLVSARV